VLQSVQDSKAQMAIIPIESSSDGTFMQNYDALIRSGLVIRAELSRVEEHCIAGLPNTELKNARQVLSHPDIINQCSHFLVGLEEELGRSLLKVPKQGSSQSCEWIVEHQLSDAVAICTQRSADALGLKVFKREVGNDRNLQTRYLVVAREGAQIDMTSSSEAISKSTIIFRLPNCSGALSRVIQQFSMRDANISNLVMRPLVSFIDRPGALALPIDRLKELAGADAPEHWGFLFSIEYTHLPVETALQRAVAEFSDFSRHLGTYPSFLARRAYKAPVFGKDLLSVIARG